MRAGIPIVATDTVGNNELVFDGINGRLFPVKDINTACKLRTEQYQNHTIRPENVQGTFEWKFSVETMMEHLNRVYSGLKYSN